MPRNIRRRRNNRRGNGKGGQNAALDKQLAQNLRSAPPAQSATWVDDYRRTPSTPLITQRPPKQIRGGIFWTVKGSSGTTVISAPAPVSVASYSFALTDVSDAAALASIFDQYCIYAVRMTFRVSTNLTGTLHTVIDYNDATNLASEAEALDYESCKTTALSTVQTHERFFHPCVSNTIYQTIATSAYGVGRFWLDTASPSVPHWGLKTVVANQSGAGTLIWNKEYVFGFRSSR